ncbi:MAG TPA: hypothetical protein VJA00_01260, partial [Candidatus Omnitrophota bacterium]|nr:hypothetical protein [Candidatus Omnitrophota bacterium]
QLEELRPYFPRSEADGEILTKPKIQTLSTSEIAHLRLNQTVLYGDKLEIERAKHSIFLKHGLRIPPIVVLHVPPHGYYLLDGNHRAYLSHHNQRELDAFVIRYEPKDWVNIPWHEFIINGKRPLTETKFNVQPGFDEAAYLLRALQMPLPEILEPSYESIRHLSKAQRLELKKAISALLRDKNLSKHYDRKVLKEIHGRLKQLRAEARQSHTRRTLPTMEGLETLIEQFNGDRKQMAASLGVDEPYLRYHLKKFGFLGETKGPREIARAKTAEATRAAKRSDSTPVWKKPAGYKTEPEDIDVEALHRQISDVIRSIKEASIQSQHIPIELLKVVLRSIERDRFDRARVYGGVEYARSTFLSFKGDIGGTQVDVIETRLRRIVGSLASKAKKSAPPQRSKDGIRSEARQPGAEAYEILAQHKVTFENDLIIPNFGRNPQTVEWDTLRIGVSRYRFDEEITSDPQLWGRPKFIVQTYDPRVVFMGESEWEKLPRYPDNPDFPELRSLRRIEYKIQERRKENKNGIVFIKLPLNGEGLILYNSSRKIALKLQLIEEVGDEFTIQFIASPNDGRTLNHIESSAAELWKLEAPRPRYRSEARQDGFSKLIREHVIAVHIFMSVHAAMMFPIYIGKFVDQYLVPIGLLPEDHLRLAPEALHWEALLGLAMAYLIGHAEIWWHERAHYWEAVSQIVLREDLLPRAQEILNQSGFQQLKLELKSFLPRFARGFSEDERAIMRSQGDLIGLGSWFKRWIRRLAWEGRMFLFVPFGTFPGITRHGLSYQPDAPFNLNVSAAGPRKSGQMAFSAFVTAAVLLPLAFWFNAFIVGAGGIMALGLSVVGFLDWMFADPGSLSKLNERLRQEKEAQEKVAAQLSGEKTENWYDQMPAVKEKMIKTRIIETTLPDGSRLRAPWGFRNSGMG